MRSIPFAILFTIVFFSCRPEPYDLETRFTIYNESSHYIELTIYQTYFDYIYKDTTFQLPSGTKFSYEYINIPAETPFGGAEDSAVIVFDNSKRIIYRKNDNQSRNILDINSFTCKRISLYFYDYQYSITDDDYLNASQVGVLLHATQIK